MKKKNTSKSTTTFRFLEDLCWLLDSNKNIDFSTLAKEIDKNFNNKNSEENTVVNVKEANLIGVLPSLLKDINIFKTNEDLASFSKEVLNIEIINWNKKSRNEIIGIIICNLEKSPKLQSGILDDVLPQLLKNKEEVITIQRNTMAHKNIFSWNEAIQKITGKNYE